MSEKPIFKSTVFGGFERQSVLNYIYQEVSRNQEIQDTLNAQIEAANAAKEKAEEAAVTAGAQFAQNEQETTALRRDIGKAKEENSGLNEIIAGLNKEIERQEAIVAEKEALLRQAAAEKEALLRKADLEKEEILREADLAKVSFEQRISDLEQKNSELVLRAGEATLTYTGEATAEQEALLREASMVKTDLERRIAELEQINANLETQISGQWQPRSAVSDSEFEKVKLQIGDLMVRSHMDSERILEDARAQAKQITGKADEEARQTIDAANQKSKEIELEAQRSAEDISNQIGKFRVEIASLEEKIEQSMSSMRSKFAAIGDAINHSEQSIKSGTQREQSFF